MIDPIFANALPVDWLVRSAPHMSSCDHLLIMPLHSAVFGHYAQTTLSNKADHAPAQVHSIPLTFAAFPALSQVSVYELTDLDV